MVIPLLVMFLKEFPSLLLFHHCLFLSVSNYIVFYNVIISDGNDTNKNDKLLSN